MITVEGFRFPTADDVRSKPSEIESSNVVFDTVDAKTVVKQFCKPAFDAIQSFINQTHVSVYK